LYEKRRELMEAWATYCEPAGADDERFADGGRAGKLKSANGASVVPRRDVNLATGKAAPNPLAARKR